MQNQKKENHYELMEKKLTETPHEEVKSLTPNKKWEQIV